MKYTEIDQNRIIILQKTYNPGALHQTSDQTEIHTFFIWYPRVGREHNSPSGKNQGCNVMEGQIIIKGMKPFLAIAIRLCNPVHIIFKRTRNNSKPDCSHNFSKSKPRHNFIRFWFKITFSKTSKINTD